ncbi:MAG: acyltransferase, partial [Muribaculaceae bacterium]|nr:acyltransferase [Muribaculaceae bacterium]
MATERKSQASFIKFIAYLQVIGIILVVFGHSFHEYPDNSHGTSLLIYRLCYSFRMPLFMFVSGFLMMHTEFMKDKVPSVKRFGLVKVKRLLIPYFTLTLLTYFPRASMSGLADESVELSTSGLLQSFYVTDMLPIPYFWFLQASFLLLISTYVVISICRRLRLPDYIAVAVLIAIAICLECIDWNSREVFSYKKAISYSVFFISGIAYCRYSPQADRWLPLDSFTALGISFALWLTAFLLWEGTAYVIAASFFGIAMCIAAAKLLVRHHVTVLDHLVGANYIIFLLSWYFNVATQQILSHYVTIPWQLHTLMSLTF